MPAPRWVPFHQNEPMCCFVWRWWHSADLLEVNGKEVETFDFVAVSVLFGGWKWRIVVDLSVHALRWFVWTLCTLYVDFVAFLEITVSPHISWYQGPDFRKILWRIYDRKIGLQMIRAKYDSCKPTGRFAQDDSRNRGLFAQASCDVVFLSN